MASLEHSGLEEDIKIIRQVYSGLNGNDIDAVMNLMDPDITRVEFEGFPTAGTYKGLTAMRQHLNTGRNTWAEGACVPVDFFTAANKIVVTVHIKVRLKNNTDWIDDWIADGFVIKDGLVAEFHSFPNKQKAFEWAGIKAEH
jgi:ketosteroid isomerase-like protein